MYLISITEKKQKTKNKTIYIRRKPAPETEKDVSQYWPSSQKFPSV